MEVDKIKDNITVINDAYNASYDSMKAAIEYLQNLPGNRKIAVLGDMFELGEFAEEIHRKVGIEVFTHKIDVLVTVGELAKYIADEVKYLGGMKKTHIWKAEKRKMLFWKEWKQLSGME